MPTNDDVKKLEEALAAARESLQAEQDQGTGGKSADTAPAPTETPDLKAQIAAAVAEAMTAQGTKSEPKPTAPQAVDMPALVRQAVAEALAVQQAPVTGADIKAIVSQVLSEVKAPRKTPLSQPENADEDGRGSKGGGTYIPQHKLGEKDNFNTFLCAVGRKDRATIHDIQYAHKVVGYGGKALVEGTGALDSVAGPSGGFLVPPDFVQDVIPLLYPYVVVRRAGAKVFTMRSPQMFQPRLTGGATASYVGETAAIPSSQQTLDQFSLLAKELTALVPISRLLVEDSDPAVEDMVKTDMSEQIGLKEDYTFLSGVGSSTVPQGILTRGDVQAIPVVSSAHGDVLSYNDIVDMMTAIDVANIPEVNRVWIAHPNLRGTLRKIKDSAQRPIFQEYFDPQQGTLVAGRPNGTGAPMATLFGRPFYTSTQLPTTTVGDGTTYTLNLVEMSQVVIGQLGGLEIATSEEGTYVDGNSNTISAFQQNLVLYRMVLRHDINLYHPGAVVTRQGLLA